jgi:hypothetical protein
VREFFGTNGQKCPRSGRWEGTLIGGPSRPRTPNLESVVSRPALARRPSTRVAAGTLALALPLALAAGCGAEKKRTIKAEFQSVGQNMQDSKSLSVAVSLKDPKSSIEKAYLKDNPDTEPALVRAITGGSISVTLDPAGDKTLKQYYASGARSTDIKASLGSANFSVVIKDDKSALGEIRLVDSVLYAHVDLDEIGRLAKAGGVDDFDEQLDAAASDEDNPEAAQAVKDVRAGKWLQLPLKTYLDDLQDLVDSADPDGTASKISGYDFRALGDKVFAKVKPYVKVTDANDSATNRVLDVKVQVKPAVKAALNVLKATKDLPFPNVFADIDPADVDDEIKDGTAHGTISLKSGHLSQVTVDLQSIFALAPDDADDVPDLTGSSFVVDVDDTAGAVSKPDDVSSLDIAAIIDQIIGGFSGGDTISSGVSGDTGTTG